MTLSTSTLLAIQQAGQGLYAARQAVADEVQSNSLRVVAFLASQPFSTESDKAYKQLRSAARLAHELLAIEDQLKALYASAEEMGTPETSFLVALPSHVASSKSHPAKSREEAQDVPVKPAKPVRAAKSIKVKPAKAPTESVSETKSGAVTPPTAAKRLSPNAEKVLGYLKGALDRRSWKAVTHATISENAGIPLGSVGVSLNRLIVNNALRERDKGSYRLA